LFCVEKAPEIPGAFSFGSGPKQFCFADGTKPLQSRRRLRSNAISLALVAL
jgi:hypothetical protein